VFGVPHRPITPRRLLRLVYDRAPETPVERTVRIVRERCPELSDADLEIAFTPKRLTVEKSPGVEAAKSTEDGKKRSRRRVGAKTPRRPS
jgi:hypothetical protein